MTIDHIKTLQEKSRKLTLELERSLHIMRLWPEAFDLGAVTSQLVGPVSAKAGEMRWVIRRSDGQERSFPAVLDPKTRTWQLPERTK